MKTICLCICIIYIVNITASPTFDKLFGDILTELYNGNDERANRPYYNGAYSQQRYPVPQQQYQYSQQYRHPQQNYQYNQQNYQQPQQYYQYPQNGYQPAYPHYPDARPIVYNGYYNGQQHYQPRPSSPTQQNSYSDICRLVNANGFTNPGGVPKCPY